MNKKSIILSRNQLESATRGAAMMIAGLMMSAGFSAAYAEPMMRPPESVDGRWLVVLERAVPVPLLSKKTVKKMENPEAVVPDKPREKC